MRDALDGFTDTITKKQRNPGGAMAPPSRSVGVLPWLGERGVLTVLLVYCGHGPTLVLTKFVPVTVYVRAVPKTRPSDCCDNCCSHVYSSPNF